MQHLVCAPFMASTSDDCARPRGVRRVDSYSVAERHYRLGGAIADAASAVSAGALNVSTLDQCSDLDALGVVALRVAPAASSCAFSPRGGVFALTSRPGAFLLPHALDTPQQEALIRACLREYCEPPQRRNIDLPGVEAPQTRLWAEFVASSKEVATTSSIAATLGERRGLASLCWATFGALYDWSQRVYHLPIDPDWPLSYALAKPPWVVPMPSTLAALAVDVVGAVAGACAISRAPASEDGTPFSPFLPQGGIVNFYRDRIPVRAIPMGGHRDDAERTLEHPIVSISLGAPAVFLLGGDDRNEPPTPLLLQSGDVVLLAGKARGAVHGVPRIFDAEAPQLFVGGGEGGEHPPFDGAPALLPGDAAEEAAFAAYMRSARISLNVRQVVADELPSALQVV